MIVLDISGFQTIYDTLCVAYNGLLINNIYIYIFRDVVLCGFKNSWCKYGSDYIIFSVYYANGDTCTKSFTNLHDVIGPIGIETVNSVKIGRMFEGIVGGIESWRGWRNWTHTVTKNCHSACMPNWCLESNDNNSCFPSGIYVFNEKSTQEGNKFTLYISRQLINSITTCSDILTDTLNLRTHSTCSYHQSTLTIILYVGNGHEVSSTSKICIDSIMASPANVVTESNLNCMDVTRDLPTISITAPTEGQKFSYVDPITITASSHNMTNVASHTFVFETVSGPTSYSDFSATNETSKTILANSLSPGTYVFRVYLDIGDSGNFAPNDTVTVEILTNLTSTSQIGNRFYFTFDHSLPTPVSDCTLVNVGLGLLGTNPTCSSTTNVLTIESNLTDSTYVPTNTIGISDILTAHVLSLTVVHGPPSLTENVNLNSGELDGGVDNEWYIYIYIYIYRNVVLNGGNTLTIDVWTWTKISGPAISFTSNQSTQSYLAETLQLGGLYVLSVTITFTNAPWLTFTHQFTPQKINFGIISNTQSESKLTIVLSDSRVIINSCGDIFDSSTVSKLGNMASCTYTGGTKTLIVYANNHSLSLNSNLVYSNPDLMSTTTNFVLGSNLPSASLSINGSLWILDSSVEYVLTINTIDLGIITAPQIVYEFTYVSGPFISYIFPNILDNVSTIPALSLSPGEYEMKIGIKIADYEDYTYYVSKTFTMKATKTELVNQGPRFNITLNTNWGDIISSCSDIFEAGSMALLTSDSQCVRDESKKNCLYVYAGNTSTISAGDSLTLNALYYINNTLIATDSAPIFSSITLSDPTKHWARDQVQTLTGVIENFAGLQDYFTVTNSYMLRGASEVNITGESGLVIFLPLRIESPGNYTLTGVIKLTDTWRSVTYYQVVTDILVALSPFPSAKGMNASYPQIMAINLTSDDTLDKDTGTKSEHLTYKWEIFTDDLLTVPYAPWTLKTSENVSIAANYFPIGIYHTKLTVTKWNYFSSWTKGVLNISSSNTKLEISSPNLANMNSDFAITFEASTLSIDGSTDYNIDWTITPAIYNRYQLGGFLTVPPGTFIPGGLYELRCKILEDTNRRDLGDASPEIAISMKIAKTINVGALLITPMTGDGLTTDFSLNADTWSDPTGQALKYRFAYQILGTTSENWFRGWDYSNTVAAIKIPPGKDVFYNTVEVKVQAKTVENSTALIRKNITVKPIVIADKSAFVDNFLGTAVIPAEKLAAVAKLAFLVEEDINYAQPDACGGCDPEHGNCNSETQLCICDQGSKLSSLCNIPDAEKDKIAQVADTLATGIYIYIYIFI